MQILRNPITKSELTGIAQDQFGDLVKAVVDVGREIMAVGGELHADGEAVLIEDGSKQEDLWGINLYPQKSSDEWIEFDSMINIRPSQGNISRGIGNREIQEKINGIVNKLVS